ncbi:HD domain-containing protein [Desulfurobacterium sp.]
MEKLHRVEEKIKEILSCIRNGYVVGGAVRDSLLGEKELKDIDIVVSSPLNKTVNCIQKSTGQKGFLYTKEKPVFTLYLDNTRIDITEIQKTLEEDLLSRDFTINAIAYSLKDKKIIDPLGGLKDISSKILKPVSFSSLQKDPVRILRGIRIKNRFRFSYSEGFISGTYKYGKLLEREPVERVREELIKITKIKEAYKAFIDMRKLNVLYILFPELAEEEKIPPSGLHQYSLITHTMKTVEYICTILNKPETLNPKIVKEIENTRFSGSLSGRELLILTALLHDIGKPITVKKKNCYLTFYNHDKVGGELAEKRLLYLGFGKKTASAVKKIIKLHLRPFFLFQLFKERKLTQKATYRFIKEAGNLLPLIAVHSIADFKATSEKMEKISEEFIWFLNEKVINFHLKVKNLKPLLSGKEIMEIKGLNEGKAVGKIKEKLLEFQALGLIKTKDEAEKIIKGFSP